MLEQLKKFAELKKLQDSFKKESVTIEKQGISVTMNGNMDVEDLKLNPALDVSEQSQILKQCFNEAKQGIQRKLASQMMNSGLKL